MGFGADIGGSVDLNTYTTNGYFHQNSNSNASSGSNYPVALAGMLAVQADGNMVYQKYQTYNGGGSYQRTKYSSTWYAWDKIRDSGNDAVAAAGGGGSDEIFWENGQNVTTNYTITNGKNAMSAGPITVDAGVTVTVGAGETWTVV